MTLEIKHPARAFVIEQYIETGIAGVSIVSRWDVCAVVDTEEEAIAITTKAGFVKSRVNPLGYEARLRYSKQPKMTAEPLPALSEFNWSDVILNILALDGITTLQDLLRRSPRELLKSPHLGRKRLVEIEASLAAKNFKLREETL